LPAVCAAFGKTARYTLFDITIIYTIFKALIFIEFVLSIIRDTLRGLIQTEQVRGQVTEQAEQLMIALGNETLSAKGLLNRPRLKRRPALGDNCLFAALELGMIEMAVPGKLNSGRQK